jgi:DNA-binding GntR family transcriptional regulator
MDRAVIRNRPLHEQAIDQLREMIVEGILKPGDRISEKDLCDSLGISRTPLREALKVLAAEGLVTLFARRGAAVSDLTGEKLEEKFEAIRMVEAFALSKASEDNVGPLIDRLQAIQDEMAAALAKGNVKRYFASNEQFHKAIVASTGNPTLIDIHTSLSGHLRRARVFGLHSHPINHKFINEHARVIKALRRNDFAGAQKEISSHLEAVERGVLKVLEGR